MITTNVKIVKLFQAPNHVNWFTAMLFIEVSEHIDGGGNQISCTTGVFHKLFWMKEFKLTEEQFNKLIIK